MNGKQLKNSILQWAIEGKLVPQDPNDEPASVLLEQIRAEKARLVKEKKIKQDKNESIILRGDDNSYYEKVADGTVKCIDDEIPFEIPASWEWCRLSSITSYLHRGKSPMYGEAKLLPIIAQKCNQWDKIYTDRCLFSEKGNITKYSDDQFLKVGDVIINSTGGGTVGRTGYVDKYVFETYKQFVADSHVTVVRCMNQIISRYIYYYLLSPYIQIGIEERCSGSTNQIELGTNTIAKYLVPVPPMEEQKRIIDKIMSVNPLIESYSTSQLKLEDLNKKVYANLRKSILQEAIQGKLVPQIASEGDASVLLQQIELEKQKLVNEGKLKKKDLVSSTIFRGDDNKYYENVDGNIICIDDEVPYSIPSNWVWCRLSSICSYIHRGKSPKYSLIKEIPVIAQKCNQWSGFIIEKAQFIDPESIKFYSDEHKLQNGDLLWNSTGLGTLGRMAIYESCKNPYGIAVADSHVTVIRAIKKYALYKYLYAYFTSPAVQNVIEEKSDGSTKQKELATRTVMSYLVPLPPLGEQKRIVDKIDRIVTSIMSR